MENFNYFIFEFQFSSNESPSTKTEYFYKTHQSGSVSIPNRQRGNKVQVGPDDDESEAYITKIDTTLVNPRKNYGKRMKQRNYEVDDDGHGHLKPFFRTGEYLDSNY